MTGITSHVLDTSRGRPASGVEIVLSKIGANHSGELGEAREVARAITDADGRVSSFGSLEVTADTYQLRFHLASYFADLGISSFYPYADVVFRIADPSEHYHVPLLLNPFGYSTYRGS